MIFQHTIDKVLSGEKTQTRRIVKSKEILSQFMTDEVLYWRPCVLSRVGGPAKWYVGHTYAVQPGRGKKAIARIRILDIRKEDVRSISHEDVRAEGFGSCVDFWRVWCQINDPRMIIWNVDATGIWCANLFKGERVPKEYDTPARNRKIMHAIGVEGLKQEMMKRPAELYQAWAFTFELVQP